MTNRGFIESDSEQIYYESWGDGDDTVVLGHGMGGNHTVWYQQVAFLARRYRVVTWDQRGFGNSTANSGDVGPVPSVTDLSRLLDHLGVEKGHIVGQSMGGWSALGFAIAHPHRTRSLVLADTTAGIFTPQITRTLQDYGEQISQGPPPTELPLGHHPAVGSQLLNEDIAHSFLYNQLGSLRDPLPPTVVIPLLMATDHTGQTDQVKVPTLFVVGENDPIFPVHLIESAATFIDQSQVTVVEDTGHSPYFERPGRWNDIVLEFLRHSTT